MAVAIVYLKWERGGEWAEKTLSKFKVLWILDLIIDLFEITLLHINGNVLICVQKR